MKKINKKMLIFGHRGAPAHSKENTIDSFKKALKQKVDGIELDVQITKDDKLVIYHDQHLIDNKTKIKKITKDQIVYTNKKQNKNIAFLEEIEPILQKIKILNIEIKGNNIFFNKIIKKVLGFIAKNKIENKTIISSFNPALLYKIKQINKKIKIGYLFSKSDVFCFFKTYHWGKIILPNTFHPDIKFLNFKMIKWAKRNKIKIYCFTVNNKEQLTKAIKHEIDGIFTDDPKKMKQMIEELK